ncbi:TrkH family potassium uptake protein [Peptoniphilus sp. AGMB00490]|uniref:TrkH family potassium uptake protein n=2 Tax=Peptoniphilus TaxID=162289 RepID=A0ACD6AZT2_9FIRM|nr:MULTISPECIES: TrkH family potassium uptake protein [Peptoniphilus]NMW85346.1 TrkH family potassium uptake protein [Peptoniphilus faecalis]OLR65237.1 potassium transporter KefA [Peptoniphilus porci]
MNYKLISKILGYILLIETAFMAPSLILSLIERDGSANGFIIPMAIAAFLGLILINLKVKKISLAPRDGILIVTASWILVSIVGAIPLFISAKMTYVDSFFEIVSGFTTTGATVISGIESFPRSIILWRSITHWIGGMGILVFTVGLLPKLGVGGFQIFKAESPGPVAGKIESTISQSSKRLYIIYITLSAALFICLKIAGMPAFDSFVHTFGVLGTGGFSSYNDSFMSYKGNAVHFILAFFMFLSSTNFTIYALISRKKFKEVLQNDELKLWILITVGSIVLIALDLFSKGYNSLFIAFRDSAFQVTSISSTSGFANADYDLWPSFSKFILLILMIFGGCAGSTGGGIKIIRISILLKLIKREMRKATHPKAVLPVVSDGKTLSDEVVLGINAYLGTYFVIAIISTGIVTLSGTDIITGFSSVTTTLSNVGPGFGEIGPTKNFYFYSDFLKLYFSALMLLGRLEFFTILALFSRSRHRKDIIKL